MSRALGSESETQTQADHILSVLEVQLITIRMRRNQVIIFIFRMGIFQAHKGCGGEGRFDTATKTDTIDVPVAVDVVVAVAAFGIPGDDFCGDHTSLQVGQGAITTLVAQSGTGTIRLFGLSREISAAARCFPLTEPFRCVDLGFKLGTYIDPVKGLAVAEKKS